jgi:hypothetical protein
VNNLTNPWDDPSCLELESFQGARAPNAEGVSERKLTGYTGVAWLSSVLVVKFKVKSANEQNPSVLLRVQRPLSLRADPES